MSTEWPHPPKEKTIEANWAASRSISGEVYPSKAVCHTDAAGDTLTRYLLERSRAVWLGLGASSLSPIHRESMGDVNCQIRETRPITLFTRLETSGVLGDGNSPA